MSAMINYHAEFFQGTKGQLFRFTRTPRKINAHIIYIAPLFEQANQTRHISTRSATNAYSLGVQSIVFDHFGTGDSAGELIDATLMLWQQDIVKQIRAIKASSSKPIFLSVVLSAALLLNDEIVSLIDGVLFAQPEFNGKSFTRQLKRMAVAGNLVKSTAIMSDGNRADGSIADIAGYQFTQQLFNELAKQNINKLSEFNLVCIWFEWLTPGNELTPSRVKSKQDFQLAFPQTKFVMIDDDKYWQSTELQLAQHFLQQDQQEISRLVKQNKATGQ